MVHHTKMRTIGLPTTESGDVDIDKLETETATYGDVEEGDIVVFPDYEYVALVVADPVLDVRLTPDGGRNIVHIPVMDYSVQRTIQENMKYGDGVREQKSMEVFHDIAINIGHERGEDDQEIEIVSEDSRRDI